MDENPRIVGERAPGKEDEADASNAFAPEWDDEPGIFEVRDLEAEAASIARARADVAAGRVYDHALVGEWLKTWGKPGRESFFDWLKQDRS